MAKTTVQHPLPFRDINIEQFRRALDRYASLIESVSSDKKPRPGQKSLIELDRFRYQEAPALFNPTNGTKQMGHEHVKALVEWKLRHGKFRPTLMNLVSSNESELVKDTIAEAIQGYREDDGGGDVQRALGCITRLKGIGPATASLLLSVHDPDEIIFFSDEAFYWLCCKGKKSPVKYNAKEYLDLNSAARSLVQRLRVGATDIEKVAYVVMNQPEFLEEGDSGVVDDDDDNDDGNPDTGSPAKEEEEEEEKKEEAAPRESKKQGGKRKVADLDGDGISNKPTTTHLRRSKRGKQD